MENIQVSVVIPLYNGADHIIKCIDNLDKQDCSFLYEVLVVDDCSTDGSASLVENYMKGLSHAKFFHLIRSSRNGRAGTARNIGIQAAKGHYVLFNDQDDYPDIKMLRVLWEHSQNGTVDLVSCAVMDRDGKPYYRPEISADHVLTQKERTSAIGCYGYVFASLIKRSVLIENKIYFAENVMFEDCLYNAGVMANVDTIQTIKEVLYNRENDENSQTANITAKKLNDRITAVKIYLDCYRDNVNMQKYMPWIKIVAFYYVYLSCMFWLVGIPKLYTKELFDRCLSEAKEIHVAWNDVFYNEKGFSKPVMHILRAIYYVPVIAYPVRICGTTVYKILRSFKKK